MKEINLHNCYSYSGSLELDLWFVELFNFIPDYYQYYKEDLKMKTSFFTLEKCKELFGENVDIRVSQSEHIYSTSKAEEHAKAYDPSIGAYKNKREPIVCIINHNERWISKIDENTIKIYHYHYDVKSIVNKILEVTPLQEEISKTATIDLVAYDDSYYTINSKIKRTEINLDNNYNDDFKDTYRQTIKFLNERESGLVLWYGEKGSGKTSAIRHLLSHTDKKYLLVTNAVAAHMGEPEFISFMMENKDSIFILEDCEQVLMAREENRFGGAIANILNMSDGLMSDIFNIKFICTFNTDIENIDEALLRPGRCFVNYEFKPLCKEKTANLLKSLGHEIENPKEMTLAEIYNYKPEDKLSKPVSRKIGF